MTMIMMMMTTMMIMVTMMMMMMIISTVVTEPYWSSMGYPAVAADNNPIGDDSSQTLCHWRHG